jgi:hypothetical protein
MFLLILMGGAYRLFRRDSSREPDQTGFLQFAGVMAALTFVILLTR